MQVVVRKDQHAGRKYDKNLEMQFEDELKFQWLQANR